MVSQGSFRGLDKLIESNDLITGDKFLDFSRTTTRVNYWKTDFLYKSGVWRGAPQDSLISKMREFNNQVLVLGHSDRKTSGSAVRIISLLTGVKKIYGTNLRPVQGMSEVLPLGLTNNSKESELHNIFGNNEHFLLASEIAGDCPVDFNQSIYVNFTIENNVGVRGLVSKLLSELPSTYKLTVESPLMSNEGRVHYLASLRRMNFVLCPEGNGMDTHRLWETLYMGGVPVVVKNKHLDSLYSQLPLVRLNSWSDLLYPSILEEKWKKLQEFEWDDALLSQSYWLKKISKDLELD